MTSCPASKDLDEYNRCTLRLLREITPELPHGIKEANVPPLDPFFLKRLTMSYNFPSLRVVANVTNIRIKGATNYILEDLYANPNNLTLKIKIRMPYVETQSNYAVRGQLLILPITSIGHFHGNFCKYQESRSNRKVTNIENFVQLTLTSKRLQLEMNFWMQTMLDVFLCPNST